MPTKAQWVEPKKTPERKPVVMDISKRVVNRMSDLLAEWEVFVTVMDELPDMLRMNERQYVWYVAELTRYAEVMGLPVDYRKGLSKPTYRGLPIKVAGTKNDIEPVTS